MVQDSNRARVAVSKEGPYLVSGDVPLSASSIDVDAAGQSTSWEKGPASPRQAAMRFAAAAAPATNPTATEPIFGLDFKARRRAAAAPRPNGPRCSMGRCCG